MKHSLLPFIYSITIVDNRSYNSRQKRIHSLFHITSVQTTLLSDITSVCPTKYLNKK